MKHKPTIYHTILIFYMYRAGLNYLQNKPSGRYFTGRLFKIHEQFFLDIKIFYIDTDQPPVRYNSINEI